MTSVAAVLVTRDAERWLPPLLASIAAQTRPADRLVVVDDGSTDGTRDLLAEARATVLVSASTAADVTTRIAQNFVQGVRACADADLVVLGDHDDVWHTSRIAHQAGVLVVWADALMIASDGVLVDVDGVPTGGTLRTSFPVTADWDALSPADRMRAALKSSVATGGASMIRPRAFPDLAVPPGWLHDRWWSLVATGRNGMLVDRQTVIDYRVQPEQQLGLDRGAQASSGVGRFTALAGRGRASARKAGDLRRLRTLIDDPAVADVVTLRNVL
jgi:glycosyltransferase involved in cell wall biosynthesis